MTEFGFLNGEEWVQPPIFDKPGEALEYMDQQERAAIAEMEAEARLRMEADAEDPTQQSYFLRLDTRTVVKDDKEYVRCQLKGVPLRVIPYGHALQALKEEEARKSKLLKEKRKKKASKQARKRNRR